MAYGTPARALGLCDPSPQSSLARLLRAVGTPEACITGEASDYDKFAALAAALPLSPGHAVTEAVGVALARAGGLSVPLCPHTAAAHWLAMVRQGGWDTDGMASGDPMEGDTVDPIEDDAADPVGTHAAGSDVLPMAGPCPHCTVGRPSILSADRVSWLPSPGEVSPGEDYRGLVRRWQEAVSSPDGDWYGLSLSPMWTFLRPDPYHAERAVRDLATGACSSHASHLLTAQVLRLVGEGLCRRGGRLLLLGGCSAEVVKLVDYLREVERLPSLVWLPCDSAEAGVLSGYDSRVGTGVDLRGLTAEQAEAVVAAYARVAPLGRCVALTQKNEGNVKILLTNEPKSSTMKK